MKGLTLPRMAKACGARLVGTVSDDTKEVMGIVTDSREMKKDFLFVALTGERVDGHDYISDVFAKGALAAVSERKVDAPGPYLLVESCREALRKIAALYLEMLAIPVVGITGSVGKTSTKEMIASVLSQRYRVHKTEKNKNNEIGLPLTVFGLRDEHELAVLEMGISNFGEMSRLAEIARPDVAVITNIGICHLEDLGDRDGVLRAKTEVFDFLKEDATVVLNGDDDKLCTIREVQGRRPYFYGMGETVPQGAAYEKKLIFADGIENHGLNGIDFDLHLPSATHRVHVVIPGGHNVYNAMAAASVGLAMGLSETKICAGIEAARTIDGRTNLIPVHDYLVIDDCYNANPMSMKAALDVLSQAGGRTVAVLGDMGDLGTEEQQIHYDVGVYAAKKQIDVLFAAGERTKELVRGVADHTDGTEVLHFDTRDELIKALVPFVRPGDTILVKASHFMDYPRVVEVLTK